MLKTPVPRRELLRAPPGTMPPLMLSRLGEVAGTPAGIARSRCFIGKLIGVGRSRT